MAESLRRAHSRLRVRLPVRLITLTNTWYAVLCDLSLTGAKVEIDKGVVSGEEAILQWSKFEDFGKICWVGAGRFGIEFHDPITPQELIATRDLDDAEHLADDRELTRMVARSWAEGTRRL